MTNQNNDKSKNGKRIALILVALLLIAAIAFGAYTYSKYVSDASGSGTATVAKWGFNMSITDNSANGGDKFGFANDYSSSGTAQNSEDSAVISASAGSTNIVAPVRKEVSHLLLVTVLPRCRQHLQLNWPAHRTFSLLLRVVTTPILIVP